MPWETSHETPGAFSAIQDRFGSQGPRSVRRRWECSTGPEEITQREGEKMAEQFRVGDHVRWNSEAGYVEGVITEKHTKDVEYKGHMRRCSEDDPQYEIKSDKTDHVAMHKGDALQKL